MGTGDIKYVISVDSTGALKHIQDFDKAVDGLAKTTDPKAKSAFGGLWKQFAVGQIATDLLRSSWRMLKDQVGDSIKAAMEAEKADKALDAALEITGRSAAKLSEHFKDYASSLQKMTIYDDEAIKGAQALLVQMTSLDRDGIDRATRGAIGLASVFGMDLQSAASLVQKAMEGNFGALGRYGIRINETLPLEEKRAQLLAQLEKLFGRATAETGTFSGQLEVLKNRWGEIQEAAAGWVTQQKGIIELFNKASQAVLDYLTMNEMLDKATMSLEEKENQLAQRLGAAAAAAGWQYREMAALIEQYHGNFAALVDAINKEKYGTEIKLAYIEALRKEKAAWEIAEAARRKAERGQGGLNTTLRTTVTILTTALPKAREWRAVLEGWTTTITEGALPAAKNLDWALEAMGMLGPKATETASVWDIALQSMTARLVSFGDANASVWTNIGSIFGNFVQSAISGMESLWIRQLLISKNIIKAKQGEATASHIGNIFKALPFPIDLIVAAGAFSVVNALFSKILKFKEGGYFPSAIMLPPHVVGEGGPEYYLPEAKLERTLERVIVKERTAGGEGIVFGSGAISVVINAQTLDERVVQRAGGLLWREIEAQARIRGRRLN